MELTRAYSKINNGKCHIYLYGFLNNKYITQTKLFNDYFYYPTSDLLLLDIFALCISILLDKQYISMYGVKMSKVLFYDYKVKKTIISIDDMFKKAYSLDIKPEIKYILDNKLLWSLKKNVMFFDILTWVNPDFNLANKPLYALMPITSIQTYNNVDNKYYILVWHDSFKKSIKDKKTGINIIILDDVTYVHCINLLTVINTFFALLQEHKIDCISGWYSGQYDLPYIINRCKKLGIPPLGIDPSGNVYIIQKLNKWTVTMRGLDHIDMMLAVDDLDIKRSDDKLKSVALSQLHDLGILKLKTSSWRDWQDDLLGFLKYGLRDVQILKLLDKKLHIMTTYCSFQYVSNIISLSQVFTKTNVALGIILKMFWNLYVFPNKMNHEKLHYSGAIVFMPVPGLHKNVALLDFKSLYPTTISTYNLSPETYVISQKQALLRGIDIDKDIILKFKSSGIPYIDTGYDLSLTGKRYIYLSQDAKLGIFAKALKKLLEMRMQVRKQMYGLDKNDTLYIALNKKQYAIKIIMNGMYGAFANQYYRFYKILVADSITYFARIAITTMFKYFETKYKLLPIYGDSDSVAGSSIVRLDTGLVVTILLLFNRYDRITYFNGRLFALLHKNVNLPYYNLLNNSINYGSVNYILRHKTNKKIYNVILLNNKNVIVSLDHSIMINNNNNIIMKKPNEIFIGDLCITLK